MSGLPLAVHHPDRVHSLGLVDAPLRTSALQTRLVRNLSDDLRAKYPTWPGLAARYLRFLEARFPSTEAAA